MNWILNNQDWRKTREPMKTQKNHRKKYMIFSFQLSLTKNMCLVPSLSVLFLGKTFRTETTRCTVLCIFVWKQNQVPGTGWGMLVMNEEEIITPPFDKANGTPVLYSESEWKWCCTERVIFPVQWHIFLSEHFISSISGHFCSCITSARFMVKSPYYKLILLAIAMSS